MKVNKLDVYFTDNKTNMAFNDVEWFKEPFGVSIKSKTVFPNINSSGEVELFIPYTSILKIKVATLDKPGV